MIININKRYRIEGTAHTWDVQQYTDKVWRPIAFCSTLSDAAQWLFNKQVRTLPGELEDLMDDVETMYREIAEALRIFKTVGARVDQ